jgi:hypothetical protein
MVGRPEKRKNPEIREVGLKLLIKVTSLDNCALRWSRLRAAAGLLMRSLLSGLRTP